MIENKVDWGKFFENIDLNESTPPPHQAPPLPRYDPTEILIAKHQALIEIPERRTRKLKHNPTLDQYE